MSLFLSSAFDDLPSWSDHRRGLFPGLLKGRCLTTLLLLGGLCLSGVRTLFAQDAVRSIMWTPPSEMEASFRSPTELKRLSLEELVDTEISSASRRPEPISQASSAIDVVTDETIRRSGVTNIPDALRLAAGVEVAQIDGHTWAISARGFNLSTSNKMQVLMDGRSLYTPLFSGVFWDVQRTFLPDLEQIEVVRGPGATLWGANAVNGVINIQTKHAKDTQGFVLDTGGGNEEGYVGVRYGGRIGRDTYYRAYVMHQRHDDLNLEWAGDGEDDTEFTQGGFRIDSKFGIEDTFTVQGDGYVGSFGQFNGPDIDVDGGNIIARWGRQLGLDSTITVQGYFDFTHRLIPNVFEERRQTGDIELEGRFVWGQHDVVYGANYRVSCDDIGNLGPTLAFLPAEETVHLISGYVHDEWHIVPRKFTVAVGSEFEYNTFSGFEIQPTARFAWTPTSNQTFWGAISRAVRTPTRIDQDLVAPNPAFGGMPILLGNRDFESEELIACEVGYRVQPTRTLFLDFAAYYHDYEKLRSVEPIGVGPVPVELRNRNEGESYGGTAGVRWGVTDWWQLAGNVTILKVNVEGEPGSRDPNQGRSEWNDPDYFFSIRSSLDLPGNIEFDSIVRYVDDLPHPATPSYCELDLRLGWSPVKNLELAVVGRNLLDPHHPEFRGTTVSREVRRSVLATLRWTY